MQFANIHTNNKQHKRVIVAVVSIMLIAPALVQALLTAANL